MKKTIMKKVASILLMFTVLFSGLPALAGPIEADAASSYWKNLKVKATTSTKNTITWDKLKAKQRGSISGIAVYRGTTTKNMKLLKRIKKTSVKYVDAKAKAGKKYYYMLKTYTKKGNSYRYKNTSPVKKVVTKTETLPKKDSKFKVWMGDREWDLCDGSSITFSAESSGTIKWTSSDPSVATVKEGGKNQFTSHSGIVTLKGAGTTTITATNYDGQTKSATITVLGKPINQLDEEPNYAYRLKFFNQAYTSNPNYFFLETDNPSNNKWDPEWYENSHIENGDYIDIEVLDADGNDVSRYTTNDIGHSDVPYSIHLSPGGLFDDIQYVRWYRDNYNTLKGEVRGGYLGEFTPPSSGTYTIKIREYHVNEYDITKTKPKTLGRVTVLDSAQKYKEWMQQVINNCTDASMTKPEKMQAICQYIVNVGHYPDCLTNEALDEYEKQYGESHGYAYIDSILGRDNVPAFVCLCWDSYTSTYLLEDFGEMIEYPVRSLYGDYQPGTAEWASNHYLVQSVDDGSYYMACPVGKKEYNLDEIEKIDPIAYQDYWAVLE